METTGVPFRLASDLDIVSVKKEMLPLCEFLRRLCDEQGIAEMQLEDHVLQPAVWPSATRLTIMCRLIERRMSIMCFM